MCQFRSSVYTFAPFKKIKYCPYWKNIKQTGISARNICRWYFSLYFHTQREQEVRKTTGWHHTSCSHEHEASRRRDCFKMSNSWFLSHNYSHCCTRSLSPNLALSFYAIRSFPRAPSDLSSNMSGTFPITGTELHTDPGHYGNCSSDSRHWGNGQMYALIYSHPYHIASNFLDLIYNK